MYGKLQVEVRFEGEAPDFESLLGAVGRRAADLGVSGDSFGFLGGLVRWELLTVSELSEPLLVDG